MAGMKVFAVMAMVLAVAYAHDLETHVDNPHPQERVASCGTECRKQFTNLVSQIIVTVT